jgi:tetratricopeptide (TPR) repeat protein
VKLAPGLGEAHANLSRGLVLRFEFAAAAGEAERALALAPGNADVLASSASFLSLIGRSEAALASARHAIALDPLNPRMHRLLGNVYSDAHRFPEAIAAYGQAYSLNPEDTAILALRGVARLPLGQFEAARADCAAPRPDWATHTCLAIAYEKLHRHADAQAELAALTRETGDTAAYQYAQIHAQWGETGKALDWLDTGYRIQDPGLGSMKVDALVDPLRGEPRFRQLLAKLKFPD